MIGILVPIFFMACVAACIMAPGYFRSRDRAQVQETLRVAMEKGANLPPELLTALQQPTSLQAALVPSRERDLRRAIILIAAGLGFAVLGYCLWQGIQPYDDNGAWVTAWSVACFGAIPGLIGIGYLVLWATKKTSPKSVSNS
ncbi:MAG TPA: DUF6249 domain-containing protein [Caulobacteraceae bacterium]|jgi:hypothetical protein|nr:DUF6249 domain-containing protein [Caulobacteraceae bacterium]